MGIGGKRLNSSRCNDSIDMCHLGLRRLLRLCSLVSTASLVLLAVLPSKAAPAGLRANGAVSAFADGDSFELRLTPRWTAAIRLHAIDAPE